MLVTTITITFNVSECNCIVFLGSATGKNIELLYLLYCITACISMY